MTNAFTHLRRTFLKGLTFSFLSVSMLSSAAFAQEKPDIIRIGTTAPGHLKFILGRHNGAFEKEFAKDGIKVELVAFTNGGSEALTALATGAIEVTYTGNNPALAGRCPRCRCESHRPVQLYQEFLDRHHRQAGFADQDHRRSEGQEGRLPRRYGSSFGLFESAEDGGPHNG